MSCVPVPPADTRSHVKRWACRSRAVPTSASIAWRVRASRSVRSTIGCRWPSYPITPRSRRPAVAAARRASASASSPGATPHRFCPTFTSTTIPTVTEARCAAAAICSRPSTESAAIVIDRPRASAATRSHLPGPSTSFAMRMSPVQRRGDLRLGHGRARQAGDRPGGELAARNLGRLVGLEMGTEPARSARRRSAPSDGCCAPSPRRR